MNLPPPSRTLALVLRVSIALVWIFHGLYSKILGGIPRHRLIVARILGERIATPATLTIGALEVLLGLWVLSGKRRPACALAQTVAIIAMNTLEILRADDLLVSAAGMIALNFVFLCVVWYWALVNASDKRA